MNIILIFFNIQIPILLEELKSDYWNIFMYFLHRFKIDL
jgi:hypothetical protein